ncbi:hypothetical protein C8J56DRAFT_1038861 [Mycena floridula]|nr:hypothetical protein C8J56DRAFT_1038861 [Mycena floridula]
MLTNGSGFALKTTNLISSAMETVLDHDYAVIPMPACLALAEMFPGPEGHPNCQGRYLVLSSISQGEGRFSGIQEDEVCSHSVVSLVQGDFARSSRKSLLSAAAMMIIRAALCLWNPSTAGNVYQHLGISGLCPASDPCWDLDSQDDLALCFLPSPRHLPNPRAHSLTLRPCESSAHPTNPQPKSCPRFALSKLDQRMTASSAVELFNPDSEPSKTLLYPSRNLSPGIHLTIAEILH